jgi:nitrite reductase (NADH) large subunit
MYYIQTADRLTRTSVWLENLEGGIEHLRDVIIHDKLGVCAELERRIQHLVDTYRCEWAEVIKDPERRKWFRQFVNTEETETGIEIITERGQNRPADWPRNGQIVPLTLPSATALPGPVPDLPADGRRQLRSHRPSEGANPQWISVGRTWDFPRDGGAAIKYGKVQIAVFHFASRGQWYACQNMCPHKRAFVLSRGIIGNQQDTPKVACPLHKRTFSLETGECLSGDEHEVKVFPVRVVGDEVQLLLPPQGQLDALLGTELHCVTSCEMASSCESVPPCLPESSAAQLTAVGARYAISLLDS